MSSANAAAICSASAALSITRPISVLRLAERGSRLNEPTNTREGADLYHWFELHRAIERAEGDIAWADWVLEELGRE